MRRGIYMRSSCKLVHRACVCIICSRIHNPVLLFVVLAVCPERLSKSKGDGIVVGASYLRPTVIVIIKTSVLRLIDVSVVTSVSFGHALSGVRPMRHIVGHSLNVRWLTGAIQDEMPIVEDKRRVLYFLSSHVCYGGGIRALTSSSASAWASSNSSCILIKNSALGCVP